MSLRERLARTPPGYRFSVGRVLAIYAALMVVLFLAALDQTIVATALPVIVGDLGGLEHYSWVVTAYMLTTTVTVPVYGKLGDIYGRRPLFLVSVSVFLAGSALCGLAWSMTSLVAFRALQGLGAGGLFPLALATVGNIVPMRDRGRYQGLIGGTFAFASVAGPALGGFLADSVGWRSIFFVNLPVGALALAAIALTMPKRAARLEHAVDYAGAVLVALGSGAFLLGLVWGGDGGFGRMRVWAAFAAAAVMLAAFAAVERRAPEPILPFELLRDRTVSASVACMALVGMAMFGTIAYVPLFVQGVIGTSATSSGVVLTPLMLAAVAASVLSGQWVSRTGRYKPNAVAGPIVLAAGLLLLWRMDASTTNGEAARNMVLAGAGMGLMMQVFVLSVQNAVPARAIGAATALTQFGRSIGATLGVTLMGVIVTARLGSHGALEQGAVHRLPPEARRALADAITPGFLVAAGVALAVLLIVVTSLEEVPLRRGVEEGTLADELGEGGRAGVTSRTR